MSFAFQNSFFIKSIWFTGGAAAAYAAYYATFKDLWSGAKKVAQAHGTLPAVMQDDAERKRQERLFGPAARSALGAQWNSFVDSTLGRLAQELGKRGI